MGTDGIRKKNINPVREKRRISPARISSSEEEDKNEENQPLFLSNGVKPLDLRPLKKESVEVLEEKGLLAESSHAGREGEILIGPELERNPFIEKFAKHEYPDEESQGIIVTDEAKEYSTQEEPKFKHKLQGRKTHRLLWGAGVLSLLILFIVASTVFARLTVNLKLRHEGVALKDISAAFDTSVSKLLLVPRVVPAQKFELSKTILEEFESTGKKNVEEKARGKVKLYNAFSSSPQALVASTRFVTDSGIVLRLSKSVIVPGAKIEEAKIVPLFLEVELVADEAGDRGNLSEGVNLKIPGFKGTAKYDGFYAITSASFSGGYKGEARVATLEDLKKAQEKVTQRVYKELEEEIVRKIPPDFTLIDQLRQIEITKVVVPKVEARLDRFSVEARATAKVIVFRKGDVKTLVQSIVIPEREAKELVEGATNIQYIVRNIDFSKGRADIVLTGEVMTKAKISTNEFAGLIQGRKERSILEALRARSELATFSISFFPPWRFTAPQDPQRIKFIVDN